MRILGIFIGGGAYATALEFQVHRLWIGLRYPRYWVYSKYRAGMSPHRPMRGRTWLYNWPVFIRWTEADGA